jgi:hypothetical protein
MRTTFLVFATALMLTGCAAAVCERPASVEEARYVEQVEPTAPQDTEPPYKEEIHEGGFALAPSQYAEVWLEPGAADLGAYHVELQYDPAVIVVEAIETAPAKALAVSPISKPQTFVTGRTGIVGIAPGGAKVEGRVMVARVKFRPVAGGASSLGVTVRSIKDSAGNDITGTAGIEPQQITVTKQ